MSSCWGTPTQPWTAQNVAPRWQPQCLAQTVTQEDGRAVVTAPAGSAVHAYQAVVYVENVIPADANTQEHGNRVLGVAETSAQAGAEVRIVTEGAVSNQGWSFTPGTLLYANAKRAGAIQRHTVRELHRSKQHVERQRHPPGGAAQH